MRQGNEMGRLRRTSALLVFLSLFLPQSVRAQPATSTWECLPDETIVAIRVPDGLALAEAIIRDTKFGAVMFSKQRKAAVIQVLESGESGEWAAFQEQLEEYGITTADLLGLLAGESGYAVVMTPVAMTTEDNPAFAGFGWLEPGEELAAKMFDAIAKLIDEQDDEQPITRVDLTLADHPVMQLQIPSISIKYDKDYDLTDDYSELSEEEQKEAVEKAVEKWEESAVETLSYKTVLICRLGDRLLVAHSFQADDEEAAASTAENLSAVFGQLLATHASEGEGFVTRLTDEPGAARVMALEGLPMLELLGDVAPLVKLLRASAPSEEKAEQAVRIFGLESLGPFALRSTVQGHRWQTDFSVAVPAPRQGLMQLLDQEPLALDPPQWVPASVVRYHLWSFDLGKAYEIIKEAALREFPDQAAGSFAMVEAQVQGFAQASLPEVLSSLGNRHLFMSFGLETGEAAEEDDDVSERRAFVWQVEDEDLWARLLKAITPFAGMAPGTEYTEEQGFSGWRVKRGEHEGGLFLGKGYLMLGYGSGVVESMLSSLNNPPTGSNSLRGSKVYAKASSMLDMQPAFGTGISDEDRYMSMLVRAMNQQLKKLEKLLDQADSDEMDDESQLWVPLARAILPNQDEIEGMMGVMVSRWEVNEHGLFGQSAQEMPGK